MYKKSLLILAGLFLLAGCGGGGSSTSGNSGYSGVTTQATITTANARALSADVYSGSQLSAAPSGVAKVATGVADQSTLLLETVGILQRGVSTIVGESKSLAKVVAAAVTTQNTKNGYSGSSSTSITYDQVSGACSGTTVFSQFKETSTATTLSGTVSFSGVFSQSTGVFTSMNMTLNNLTATGDTKSYSMTGSQSSTNNGTTQTITASIVITDTVSGRTYWEKDFTFTITGSSLTLSGTYYDPIHGYVIISTFTPLIVSTVDATPTSGQLLFSGSNGTKVRLTFSSIRNQAYSFIVEAGTTGNGTYVVIL